MKKTLIALFALIVIPTFAYAQTATSTAQTQRMQSAIARADKEIDRRIAALTQLAERVTATQRVSAEFKTSMANNVQNQISGLKQLKEKIDATTDAATLKEDIQTITQTYRIYMLVLPQTHIAAAADREEVVIGMMNTLGSKLQARVTELQNAGKDVKSLLSALTDMSAKLHDADVQAQAAVSVTAQLTPDGGDKTKMAANTTALKQGRANIQAGQQALVAARKDAELVIKGIAALSASPATTTQSHGNN